jgi:hypothetical protein
MYRKEVYEEENDYTCNCRLQGAYRYMDCTVRAFWLACAPSKYMPPFLGTPTKRQISERPVSKRLKRQVYKTSGLQNVRFTKCQVYKTLGLQNVRLQKNIHTYSVLVVGGNLQVMLQPCLQAK